MKKLIWIPILIISVIFSVILAGCTGLGNSTGSGDGSGVTSGGSENVDFTQLTLKKISIGKDSPTSFNLGEIDLSAVVIVCTYVDDDKNEHTKEVSLDDTMISAEDRLKFNVVTAGSTVTVTYLNKTVQYTFTIKENSASVQYSVYFESNGGTPIATRKAGYLSYIEVPVREGYKFLGWFDNVHCVGTSVVASASAPYTLTKDVTLYAKWEDSRNYRVEFLDKDGEVIEAFTQIIVHGEDVVSRPTGPIVEGFKFISWEGQFEDIESNQQIRSTYEVVRLEVVFYTFDYQGANEKTTTRVVDYGDNLDYTDIVPQNKDGKTVRWVILNEDNGRTYSIVNQFDSVKSNYVVIPEYTPISYTVTFSDGGATLDSTLGINRWENISVSVFWGERFEIRSNLTSNYSVPQARTGHIAYWTIYDRQTETWRNLENGKVWDSVNETFVEGPSTTTFEIKYYDNSTGISYTSAEISGGDLTSVKDNISIKAVYIRETYTLSFRRSTTELAVLSGIPYYSSVCLYSDVPQEQKSQSVIYGNKEKKFFLKYPNDSEWDVEWYSNTQDVATRPSDKEVVFLDDNGNYKTVIVTKNTNYYCADIDLRQYSVDFYGYNFTTGENFLIKSINNISYGTAVNAPTVAEAFQSNDVMRMYYSVTSSGSGIVWYSVPQTYSYDADSVSIASISRNMTLYAHYQRRTYNVTYVDNKYPYTEKIFKGSVTYDLSERDITTSPSDSNERTVVMNAVYSVNAGEYVPINKIYFGGDSTVRILDEYINGYVDKLNSYVTVDGKNLTYYKNGVETLLTYGEMIKGIDHNEALRFNFNYLNYFKSVYNRYSSYCRFIEVYEGGIASGYDLAEEEGSLNPVVASAWLNELEYIMTSVFNQKTYNNWKAEQSGDKFKYIYYTEFYIAILDMNGDNEISDEEKTQKTEYYQDLKNEYGRLCNEFIAGYPGQTMTDDFYIESERLSYKVGSETRYLNYNDVKNGIIYHGILPDVRNTYVTEEVFSYGEYFRDNYIKYKNYCRFIEIYEAGMAQHYDTDEKKGTLSYLNAADWWNELEYIMTSKFSEPTYESWKTSKIEGVDDFKYMYYTEFYVGLLDVSKDGTVTSTERNEGYASFVSKRNDFKMLKDEYENGYSAAKLTEDFKINGVVVTYLNDEGISVNLKYQDVKDGKIYTGLFDSERSYYLRTVFDYEQYFIDMQTYYFEGCDWITEYEAGLAAYWDLYERWDEIKLQSATDWMGLESKMTSVFGRPSYDEWKKIRQDAGLEAWRYLYYKEFYVELLDVDGNGILTYGVVDVNGDGKINEYDHERNFMLNYYLGREEEYKSLNLELYNYGNTNGTYYKNYYNNEERKVYYELLFYDVSETARLDNEGAARYLFGGWYTSSTLTSIYNTSRPITSDNVSIFSKWIDQRIGTLGLVFELVEDVYTPEQGDWCYRLVDYVSKAEYNAEYKNNSAYSVNEPTNDIMDSVIEIPKGHNGLSVKEISANAFIRKSNVSIISSITVASTVMKIEPGAFEECINLMVLSIAEGNTVYSVGDEGALYKGTFETIGEDIIFTPTELVCYPAKVSLESDNAYFVGDELTAAFDAEIENGSYLVTVGLFRENTEASVYRDTFILPDTVTTIQSKAFAAAGNLKYIGFTSNSQLSVINAKSMCGLMVIKVGCLVDGDSGYKVVGTQLPSTLTEIGEEAFINNTAQAQISYSGTNLVKVGAKAFYKTGWYNGVSIGNAIIKIGGVALGVGAAYSNNGVLELDSSIYAIADKAFISNTSISSVVIKNTNFKRIGSKAFEKCTQINSFSIHTTAGSQIDLGEPPATPGGNWEDNPFSSWKGYNFHIPIGTDALESYKLGDWAYFYGLNFVVFIPDLL